jgi:arsenate reductase-like glutaredoxin family protein
MIKLRDSEIRYQFQVVVVLHIEYYYLIEIENQLEHQWHSFSSNYSESINEVDRNDDDVVDEQERYKQAEEKLNLSRHLLSMYFD